MSELRAGQVIDGFKIVEKVHEGGMATLWRVECPRIDAHLLMKTPIIHDGEDAAAIVGFEMEQMILPQLTGPHVPAVHGVGDFAAQPYIVMEEVEGQTLLPLLDRLPVAVEEARAIGAKVAAALADLHRQHVIHLDVKPSNIILRKADDEVVLIDYGLSHHELLPDLLSEEFTLPMGTGPYISPEQINGARADPRSDLFALGVLLYHLTTGQRPFGYPRNRAGLRKRLWRPPDPLRAIDPKIPEWFQEIVLRCLETDPNQRHPTAAQLAFDLQNPDQVRLTERGARTRRLGWRRALGRWWRMKMADPAPNRSMASYLSAAPIIVAAVDVAEGAEEVGERVRQTAERILRSSPGVRLACVNVVRLNRVGVNYALDEQGRNIHVQRLINLKIWARPLDAIANQMTFHVLEASDPAAAIIEYARKNDVDQIVIGAAEMRGRGRAALGPVASQVVMNAPCTVTIVRAPAEKSGASYK